MSAPRPATFDPLDAPLWEGYDYFQCLADETRAGPYQHTFWIDPKHWERHRPPKWVFKLKWETYQYCQIDSVEKLRSVARRKTPGVYMFSVRPEIHVTGFPSFVLYVGISNVGDSMRPVRERLADYLPNRISAIKKRRTIHRMACLYFRVLWVHFAYINKSSAKLIDLERRLHGYLAPPAGEEAFPADMKKRKPAF